MTKDQIYTERIFKIIEMGGDQMTNYKVIVDIVKSIRDEARCEAIDVIVERLNDNLLIMKNKSKR